MSYAKAMKHARNVKKCKKQSRMYFGFSLLAPNERRRDPWLGAAWFEPGRDEERAEYIRKYHEETARLLAENPNLKIVD